MVLNHVPIFSFAPVAYNHFYREVKLNRAHKEFFLGMHTFYKIDLAQNMLKKKSYWSKLGYVI